MAHDLESLRRHRTGRRGEPLQHLTGGVRERARALLCLYLQRAQERYGPVVPAWRYAGICASASRVAQCGPPPNRWQRLGYRTAKRRREWAAMLNGTPYPGRGLT